MFWFCQGVPRALCCACKNTISPSQESPFWSFFFYRIFLGNGVQNAKVAKKSRNECNKRGFQMLEWSIHWQLGTGQNGVSKLNDVFNRNDLTKSGPVLECLRPCRIHISNLQREVNFASDLCLEWSAMYRSNPKAIKQLKYSLQPRLRRLRLRWLHRQMWELWQVPKGWEPSEPTAYWFCEGWWLDIEAIAVFFFSDFAIGGTFCLGFESLEIPWMIF